MSAIKTLRESRDAAVLTTAAVEIAATNAVDGHAALRAFLANPASLDLIDPPGIPVSRIHDRRLWQILRELMDNPAALADATISALCVAPAMSSTRDRIDLLIDATAEARPATPEIISFWQKHDDPEGSHLTRIGPAAFTNGSSPALAYLLGLFLQPDIERPQIRAWLRRHLLADRTQPGFVSFAATIIRDEKRPREQRLDAAEALFDYQPRLWFHPHLTVGKPDWATSARADRQTLRELADFVRKKLKPEVNQYPTLEAGIAATLLEFKVLDGPSP